MFDVAAEDPGRYSVEIAIMQHMGWSWQELRNAPTDLVEEINVKRLARGKWQAERAKKDEALQKAKQGAKGR